jgi:hypothetical protein
MRRLSQPKVRLPVGLLLAGKDVKILAHAGRHGLPFSVSTHAVNHQEVTLVQLSFGFLHEDGWHLRHYQHRWLVERFFVWLQWTRRYSFAGSTTSSIFLVLSNSPA